MSMDVMDLGTEAGAAPAKPRAPAFVHSQQDALQLALEQVLGAKEGALEY
jgi:hypothetical protein